MSTRIIFVVAIALFGYLGIISEAVHKQQFERKIQCITAENDSLRTQVQTAISDSSFTITD